jgi:hypothetical protein
VELVYEVNGWEQVPPTVHSGPVWACGSREGLLSQDRTVVRLRLTPAEVHHSFGPPESLVEDFGDSRLLHIEPGGVLQAVFPLIAFVAHYQVIQGSVCSVFLAQ